MKKNVKNVVIKGAYGTKNFGDDLLMVFSYKLMKCHGCEVDILAPEMPYIYKLIQNVTINSTNRKKKYDLLIYGGGTQFFHFEKNKTKFEIREKIKKIKSLLLNPYRIKGALLRRINKPVCVENKAYLGVGIGPFSNKEVEKTMLSKFLESKFISVRDRKSQHYLDSLKVHSILGADLCFCSFFRQYIKDNNVNLPSVDLGIILRDWDKTESGIIPEQQIKNLILMLNKKKISYRFVFLSEIHDNKWINFCEKNQLHHIVWDPDKMTISYFMGVIKKCKHIVSSRYHGLVAAALLKIPFTCLSIEQKISLFAEKFPFFNNISYPFNVSSYNFKADWPIEASLAVHLETEMADKMMLEFNKFMESGDV